MQIVSWNVNGIRAVHRKGSLSWLYELSPDIFCFQEVKAEEEQVPDEIRKLPGYHPYFSASKRKKGYSGVATYSKVEPLKVNYGLKEEHLNTEGRLIETHFKDFVLFNVYFPNGGGGPERLSYKLDFYDAFLEHIEKLRKSGKSIIFCGDINTAHEEIDLARPKENEEHTGFLPEERAWLDTVVRHGYVDVFRHLNPGKRDSYTYWDMKSGARDRNVGWRIDYFFVSPDLIKKVKKTTILSTIYGSDHCPILLEID